MTDFDIFFLNFRPITFRLSDLNDCLFKIYLHNIDFFAHLNSDSIPCYIDSSPGARNLLITAFYQVEKISPIKNSTTDFERAPPRISLMTKLSIKSVKRVIAISTGLTVSLLEVE